MNKDDVARLIEMVAERLREEGRRWLPEPVRPAPPGSPSAGNLPAWSGAAQRLPDVAPPRRGPRFARHRPEYPAMVAAARQAAAGRGPAPLPAGSGAGADRARSTRTLREVRIGVSNRHLHLSQADFETLFGKGRVPSVMRPITQPGQYAAGETVRLTGPSGSIDEVRVVGPARGATQLELAPSDCRTLGISAPVRASGRLEGSTGGVVLEGPAGRVELRSGVIVAQRHLHVSPADGVRLGVADGDVVSVECGPAGRRAALHDVLVRLGPSHATELHLDMDEANALGVKTGDTAAIVGRSAARPGGRRSLLTERDVALLASRGERCSAHGPYLVTPAARDRARALGIWQEDS